MKRSILLNTLSLALCAILMFTLLPTVVLADAASYGHIDENGDQQTTSGSITLIDSSWTGVHTLTTGWYTVTGIVSTDTLTVTGDVHLILADSASLTVTASMASSNLAGITVSTGNSLTIYGQSTGANMGTLKAVSGLSSTNGAGIGGNFMESAGTIIINGGNITADGSDGGGAGIGGGGNGGDGGTVTINGGVVTAYNNAGGAGIGGGQSNGGDGGTVTISGGTVTATGGSLGGAGIGGGWYSAGGTVTINGGTVKATGGTVNAEAIGKGEGGASSGTLKNSSGADVYLTTVTLDGVSAETPVTSLTAILNSTAYAYGLTDVSTDATGKLYLYLPENTFSTAARTVSGQYAGSVTTATDTATSLGTLLPDAVAPTVSTISPSGTGAGVSGNLIIAFSEDMRDTAGTVSLNGGAALTGGNWNTGKTVYTVPYSGLAYDMAYTVEISGFNDYSGNVMSNDNSHCFTTCAAPYYDDTDYYRLTFETGGGDKIGSILCAEYTTVDLSGYTPSREGYTFTGWYADTELTERVTSFRLPKNTTVYAGWHWTNPFTDLSEDDWYFSSAEYVYQLGLMTGSGSGSFSPNSTMTRAMFVTVLYRQSGDTGSHANTFSDVPSGEWYDNATAWAAANSIAGGVGDGKFSPNGNITREQLAMMLWRYAKYAGYDVSVGKDTNILSYNDAFDISEYAYPALQWACGAGILEGDGTGNLSPQGYTTRAEVAAMLQRFIENVTG